MPTSVWSCKEISGKDPWPVWKYYRLLCWPRMPLQIVTSHYEWGYRFVRMKLNNSGNRMHYSWVPNKRPLPRLLIFEFFSNLSPVLIWTPRLFIISNIFLITCTKHSNIKIYLIKYEKNMWKICEKRLYWLYSILEIHIANIEISSPPYYWDLLFVWHSRVHE